ncbi:MAG TPA: fimbria/pilus outer membrane usher protein, partial [Verrucomicrobiae bacterium]|nr:fimbria/pilus outer membrane usher protein [Verrucomicrobiae bacterium]
MSTKALAFFLCASAVSTAASAQNADTLVVRLLLPQRDAGIDTFAWRDGAGYSVPRDALSALGIQIAADTPRVALSTIPGLSFSADESAAAIVLTCTSVCFANQQLDFDAREETPPPTSDTGGYVNYDTQLQWVDEIDWAAAATAEFSFFGPFGLIESAWLGEADDDARSFTRLETRWTLDMPAQQLRLRVGDSVALSADGDPFRFAGVQIGRRFALAPSMITYPTPTLEGDAALASTAQLYVDGVLQGSRDIEAGPFSIGDTPFVSGAGAAQLVVTDVLGRQQIISRPFFVSTTMLRPGLTDWTASIGAVRPSIVDDHYAENFASARVRRGMMNWLTLEAAIENSDDRTRGALGASVTDWRLGQFSVMHTDGDGPGATAYQWLRNSSQWSFGLDYQERAPRLDDNPFGQVRSTASANFAIDLDRYGGLAFTAARLRFEDRPTSSVYTLSYTPDLGTNLLALSLAYAEQIEEELSARISLSVPLGDDFSANASIDARPEGEVYRAGVQQSADASGGFGWRARITTGVVERVDLGAMLRGRFGETTAQVSRLGPIHGLRLGHSGSIGFVSGERFVGPVIDGAFALVDTGAANVDVRRNHFDLGPSNARGLVLAPNLRPYEANTISIDADDLPLDRAPRSTDIRVTPRDG